MVPHGEHMLFVKVNDALRIFFSLKRKSTSRELVLKLCVCSHDHHKQCLKSQGCYLRINQRALEHLDGYIHHKHDRYFPLCLSFLKSIDCSDGTLIELPQHRKIYFFHWRVYLNLLFINLALLWLDIENFCFGQMKKKATKTPKTN